jgi:hypothetical protein
MDEDLTLKYLYAYADKVECGDVGHHNSVEKMRLMETSHESDFVHKVRCRHNVDLNR